MAEELQHFAGRAKSMTSAMRSRSLAALTAALPPRKQQLFQQGQAGQPASFLSTVEEATWRLVYASALGNCICNVAPLLSFVKSIMQSGTLPMLVESDWQSLTSRFPDIHDD